MGMKTENFDHFMKVMSQGVKGTDDWHHLMVGGECMDDGHDDSSDDDRRRRGRKGRKGDRDGMGGMIDWSEDKDRIIMTGADGSKLYIEMGATKIAASVATLAAMTLY